MSELVPIEVDILLVDDLDGDRQILARAFQMADADDVRFRVWEARSVEEYHEAIKTRSEATDSARSESPDRTLFDAMVVDVHLSPIQNGGDDIVNFHHLLSPATIIIICSRFRDLDKVRTCVSALRAGAVDCVDKEDVLVDWRKSVLDSVLTELRQRHSPETGPTSAWLEQNLGQLVKNYPGQAVAMLGQKVVASARNVAELRAQLPGLGLQHTPFFMVVPNWDH